MTKIKFWLVYVLNSCLYGIKTYQGMSIYCYGDTNFNNSSKNLNMCVIANDDKSIIKRMYDMPKIREKDNKYYEYLKYFSSANIKYIMERNDRDFFIDLTKYQFSRFDLTGRERFGGCMNLKSKRDIEIEKAEQLGLFNDE